MILRQFNPGHAPCNGACKLDWAAGQAGVPVANPVPIMLPAGSVLSGMSYAKQGTPYWDSGAAYFTAKAHHGVGYRLPDGTLFFRFDACGNWSRAIYREEALNVHPQTQRPSWTSPAQNLSVPGQQLWANSRLVEVGSCCASVLHVDDGSGAGGTTVVPAVPLGSSGLFMLTFLLIWPCLRLFTRRQQRANL